MAHLGRFQLGDWIPFGVNCKTAAFVAGAPTTAPTLTVFDSNFATTGLPAGVRLPPKGDPIVTGQFELERQLDSNYSAQMYTALIEYTIGAHSGTELHTFEVVGGGNSAGNYVGLHYYDQPHVRFMIGQLDGGTLEARRNPQVS